MLAPVNEGPLDQDESLKHAELETPPWEGPAGDGQGETGEGELYPLHRVALRSLLGGVFAGGLALLPLTAAGALCGHGPWLLKQWIFVLLAAFTSAASFALADGFVRRTQGIRVLIPLLALGSITAPLIASVHTSTLVLMASHGPLAAIEGVFDLLHVSLRRWPLSSLAFAAATALPFLAGGLNRRRSPVRACVRAGVAGGLGALFLTRYLSGTPAGLGFMFLVLPPAIVVGLSLVDILEPRLAAWLLQLTSPS